MPLCRRLVRPDCGNGMHGYHSALVIHPSKTPTSLLNREGDHSTEADDIRTTEVRCREGVLTRENSDLLNVLKCDLVEAGDSRAVGVDVGASRYGVLGTGRL